ncbi:sulfotransferase family protein [Ornithinicoccus hortensis]|uniref:Sulfotransferase family protein n=1 Tax=Ornithinicoccus hortensis TaxID=82346 RepID=A0A542YVZ4_9MICO|nr:sulfotransferase [Ornithinicoccus hortensis]TQL52251.1 sulfotransferase family protein [Ornithinicoccus hortensis]
MLPGSTPATPGGRAVVAPLFVGGTGRSGTTIAAQLLGQHPDLALIPIELRFHVDAGGLCDVAAGRTDVATFEEKLRRLWFWRPPNNSGPRGIHVIAEESTLDAGLARLHAAHEADPWGACRQFIDDLVQPFVERTGARTWVEMTPPNGKRADALCRMFPDARVVHMVRDGRDVASSVARRSWGPDDTLSALTWWRQGMTRIAQSMSKADPDRVRAIRLESLVVSRREEEYAGLLEFAGVTDSEPVRRFFDDEVAAGSLHAGSWRGGLDDAQVREIEDAYERALAQLAAKGIQLPPA